MSSVLYEKRDRIAYITFNRPEAKNAIDWEMQELLVETWTDFRDDDGVDVAILTGAGDSAFSAGADLKERPGLSEERGPYPRHNRLVRAAFDCVMEWRCCRDRSAGCLGVG